MVDSFGWVSLYEWPDGGLDVVCLLGHWGEGTDLGDSGWVVYTRGFRVCVLHEDLFRVAGLFGGYVYYGCFIDC